MSAATQPVLPRGVLRPGQSPDATTDGSGAGSARAAGRDGSPGRPRAEPRGLGPPDRPARYRLGALGQLVGRFGLQHAVAGDEPPSSCLLGVGRADLDEVHHRSNRRRSTPPSGAPGRLGLPVRRSSAAASQGRDAQAAPARRLRVRSRSRRSGPGGSFGAAGALGVRPEIPSRAGPRLRAGRAAQRRQPAPEGREPEVAGGPGRRQPRGQRTPTRVLQDVAGPGGERLHPRTADGQPPATQAPTGNPGLCAAAVGGVRVALAAVLDEREEHDPHQVPVFAGGRAMGSREASRGDEPSGLDAGYRRRVHRGHDDHRSRPVGRLQPQPHAWASR